MELTAVQRAFVDHDGGPARLVGDAGTGKTAALQQRFGRLASVVGADRIVVICRNWVAAARFRDAVLPAIGGAFERLAITTFTGLALDVANRGRPEPVQLVTGAEQWAIVHELLTAEPLELWPTLGALVRRRAFIDEVAETVLHYQASFLGEEELRTHAAAAGVADRWEELAAFTTRYQAELDRRGALDTAGVIVTAALALRDRTFGDSVRAEFDAVLVDDFETGSFATNRLLTLLTGPGADVAVTGNPGAAIGSRAGQSASFLDAFARRFGATFDARLDVSFRAPAAPELVLCQHPAVEPEVIAGELHRAHASGVEWSEMAVLIRRGRQRARAVTRALARHGIPVRPSPAPLRDEPLVQAIVDVLRWANGDELALDRLLVSPLCDADPVDVDAARRAARAEGTPLDEQPIAAGLRAVRDDIAARAGSADPASLAHRVFRMALAHLVPDPEAAAADALLERSLDGVVSFLNGLGAYVERHPTSRLADYLATTDAPDADNNADGWSVRGNAGVDAVAVTTIAASAGLEWNTVVLAGCIDSELPHVTGRIGFFDRALLGGPDVPSVADRRRASRAEERRLFGMACGRATTRLLGTAAPDASTTVSPFVASWERREATLSFASLAAPPPKAWTVSSRPVWPTGALQLSATRLTTYDNCPWQYALTYAAKARSDANYWADFGTLVHAILAEYLDPQIDGARTRDRLFEIAESKWSDEIATYRPQREQARRELFELLERWSEGDGAEIAGRETFAVERKFEIEVGPHRVIGSIDRVDCMADRTIEIVDYKTSRNARSADDVAEDLQLATYHLAASRDPDLAAAGPVVRLRLLYLRPGEDREQPITAEHAHRTEARILDTAQLIVNEAFAPSVAAECDYCAFHRLCPLQAEGREVGVSHG